MRFLYEILLRVVRIVSVHGGRLYVFVERVPRPDADDFAQNACLFTAADICMAQFMNVAGGQYPFDGRGNRARVARVVFCVGGKIRGDFAEMSVTSCYKIASGCYIFVTKCRGGG